jgi:hypothetical protein
MGPPQLLIDKTGISLLEAINKNKPFELADKTWSRRWTHHKGSLSDNK